MSNLNHTQKIKFELIKMRHIVHDDLLFSSKCQSCNKKKFPLHIEIFNLLETNLVQFIFPPMAFYFKSKVKLTLLGRSSKCIRTDE